MRRSRFGIAADVARMSDNRMNKAFQPTWKTLLLGGMLAWAYFPTLYELFQRWMDDPHYSHGFLVPLFSLFLLYRHRDRASAEVRPWPIFGYVVLGLALAFRAVAAVLFFLPLDALSLVMCLTGLVMVTGGGPMLRWTWQSLVFLLFMIPLPYQIERMMGAELQSIATISTTFVLQTLGQPAISEGNRILIMEVQIGVVEACSGLVMLMTFGALCVGAVMLMERHWLIKVLVLASAVPIALITNIIRISATGLALVWLKDSSSKDSVGKFIHEFYGLLMPPVGFGFLIVELWLFKRLLIEPEQAASRQMAASK
jgi:exosortase